MFRDDYGLGYRWVCFSLGRSRVLESADHNLIWITPTNLKPKPYFSLSGPFPISLFKTMPCTFQYLKILHTLACKKIKFLKKKGKKHLSPLGFWWDSGNAKSLKKF